MAKYGVNKAILVGNLGRDPELRYLESGTAVATFSLATTERFRSKDGNPNERTEWHNVVMWRQMAETLSKFLHKGSTVYVEGRIITRSWDQDGVTRYRTEIEAEKLVLLDGKNDNLGGAPTTAPTQQQPAQQQKPQSPPENQPANTSQIPAGDKDDPDDLPF